MAIPPQWRGKVSESARVFFRVTLNRCVNVEVQAVLALVPEVRQQPLEILHPALGHPVAELGQLLGTNRAELVGDLHAVPKGAGDGRHEAQRANRRRGVGHAAEHLDALEVPIEGNDHARQLAVLSPDDPRAQLGAADRQDQAEQRQDRRRRRRRHLDAVTGVSVAVSPTQLRLQRITTPAARSLLLLGRSDASHIAVIPFSLFFSFSCSSPRPSPPRPLLPL